MDVGKFLKFGLRGLVDALHFQQFAGLLQDDLYLIIIDHILDRYLIIFVNLCHYCLRLTLHVAVIIAKVFLKQIVAGDK